MSYWEFLKLGMPEAILVLTLLGVLLVDLAVMRQQANADRRLMAAAVTGLGCAAAFFWIYNIDWQGSVFNGAFYVSPLTQTIKQVLLVLTFAAAAISADTEVTDHVGEYFGLLLLATSGFMFMVSSQELLIVFVALELTSLSLYLLTAIARNSISSAEAALKYFLFGGMSAAFLLFGLSLLYGLTGLTNLPAIAVKLKGAPLDPLLMVAIAMTLLGFGFKIAAVPFHLWAPDVYQGAPTPSAALIASGSKVASFFLLASVLRLAFAGREGSGAWGGYAPGWVPLLAVMAALSVVLGNLVAIAQTSVKRLLAYSAVAHAGYMLLGLVAGNAQGFAAMLYYVATYAFTTVGAFGVVAVVAGQSDDDRLSSFAGLSRRSPFLSLCMLVFMLSLAGIPPLAGFFGKFYLFTAAISSGDKSMGLLWLVILAIAMSAVSLYYYLQVLKQIYVQEPAAPVAPIKMLPSTRLVVGGLATAVLVLGCLPDLLLRHLR